MSVTPVPAVVVASIFKKYDANNNGEINRTEFNNLLSDLGMNDLSDICKLGFYMLLGTLSQSPKCLDMHANKYLVVFRV